MKDGRLITLLKMRVTKNTLNVGEKGAYVLFTDGDKLEYPDAKISTDSGTGTYWDYTAKIIIDDEVLEKFITKDVDAIRLFIYDNEMPIFGKKNTLKLKGWAEGILNAK